MVHLCAHCTLALRARTRHHVCTAFSAAMPFNAHHLDDRFFCHLVQDAIGSVLAPAAPACCLCRTITAHLRVAPHTAHTAHGRAAASPYHHPGITWDTCHARRLGPRSLTAALLMPSQVCAATARGLRTHAPRVYTLRSHALLCAAPLWDGSARLLLPPLQVLRARTIMVLSSRRFFITTLLYPLALLFAHHTRACVLRALNTSLPLLHICRLPPTNTAPLTRHSVWDLTHCARLPRHSVLRHNSLRSFAPRALHAACTRATQFWIYCAYLDLPVPPRDSVPTQDKHHTTFNHRLQVL